MNTDIQGIWAVAADRACFNRCVSGDVQKYHDDLIDIEIDLPEAESSTLTDSKFDRNCTSILCKLKLNDLNYDVLRNIFDRLNLTDIVSVQRVCTRFEEEAHYRRPSAKFDLQSVVMRRFGDPLNWLAETKLILEQYGENITDLDADYNCIPGRRAIASLSENVRVFCTQLKIYTVYGSLRYPDISFGQLRPNLQALHTLRLCNFSRSTTDLDVAVYLSECQRTLRILHVENMQLTGEFLFNAPDTLESLELIHIADIETDYVNAYLARNPALKRFELVTRGFQHCFPNTRFYDQIAQVEHLKLEIDNRSLNMLPLNVGPLRNFVNLKSLELDSFEIFNLGAMFDGLAVLPILERLSIRLSIPLDTMIFESLKRLKKLQYLKMKLQTQDIACEIESLILSVSEAAALTELSIESKYGGNLLPMFTYLPNLQKVKLNISGRYNNLQNMAYVRHLSSFEVRIGGDSAIAATRELVERLEEQRPIKRLTVTLLSPTEFPRDILLRSDQLNGIKSFVTRDAYEMGRIAEGRTFEVRSDALKNVRLITDLVKGRKGFETFEIVIAGEVGSKYSESQHTMDC